MNVQLVAYQTEIDNLTKRCKTSENAFLNVYKVLAEAPDPYPFLEAAVVRQKQISSMSDLQLFFRTKPSKLPRFVTLKQSFAKRGTRTLSSANVSMNCPM